jgi:hypothetical protein
MKYIYKKKLKSGKRIFKLLVGLKTRRGYIRKWIDYNKFEEKETKIPAGYKLRRMMSQQCKYYYGDENIIKNDEKIRHKGKLYFIHDNGGRPFLVSIQSKNKVQIYKMDKNTHIPREFYYCKMKDQKKL